MTSKNTPKSHSKTAIILFALLIFQMLFIFAMSSFGPDSSNAQSNFFVNLISGLVPNLKTNTSASAFDLKTLVFFVRKTAHFTEYAILGLLLHSVVWGEETHQIITQAKNNRQSFSP